jgi:hypothetical protein
VDDKTQDTLGSESPACKCKCANIVAILVGLVGGTALFAGIMVWYFTRVAPVSPWSPRSGGGAAATVGKEGEALGLDTVVLDIVPLAKMHVKIKSGKAESVEVPKESGLTANVEGDTVTITAAQDAPEGTHQLTVKGGKGKTATLRVNVKKAGAAAEAPPARP